MARKGSIDRILGASVSIPVSSVGHAPWDLYGLLDSLKGRLRPGKGRGRPTDERWTIRRLVGFRGSTWRRLRRISEASSKRGRSRMSPAQIAALLIERSLEQSDAG